MFYEVNADIMARLPEKLQNLVEFGAIGNAVNPEIDNLNAAIGLIAANAFIDTVDNSGLVRWEKILGVTSPLTVYKQKILNDPYHFTVASEKDYVKEAIIFGNANQATTPTPTSPVTPLPLKAGTKLKFVEQNILPYPYFNTSKTVNGITFTDNTDGTIPVSGTATSTTMFYLQAQFKLQSGTYRLNGCPSGGSLSTFFTGIDKFSGNTFVSAVVREYGTGAVFTVSQADVDAGYSYTIFCGIVSGVTINNLVFKPQIVSGTENLPYSRFNLTSTLITPCDLWATPDGLRDVFNPLGGTAFHNVLTRTYDGSADENWTIYTSAPGGDIFRIPIGANIGTPPSIGIFSNLVSGVTYNALQNNAIVGIRLTTSTIDIRPTVPITSLEDWKTYLSTTPLFVVFYAGNLSYTEQYPPQPITLPTGVVNMVVESENGVLPSEVSMTLAEYQADATFQARKNALKSKLMTKPPINLETLRTIIEAYMGVEVEISIANSLVSVVYRGETEVVDPSPLYATLYETIPASLLVEIAYKYLQWLELDAQGLNFDALDAKNLTWDDFERGDWIA